MPLYDSAYVTAPVCEYYYQAISLPTLLLYELYINLTFLRYLSVLHKLIRIFSSNNVFRLCIIAFKINLEHNQVNDFQ